jgi:hypothetical protein
VPVLSESATPPLRLNASHNFRFPKAHPPGEQNCKIIGAIFEATHEAVVVRCHCLQHSNINTRG